MNNKTLYFIVFVMIFLFPFSVKADECSDSYINQMMEMAENVSIEHKYSKELIDGGQLTMPKATTDGFSYIYDPSSVDEYKNSEGNGTLTAIISGITGDLIVEDGYTGYVYGYDDVVNNGIVINNVSFQNRKYYVYSKKCNYLLKTFDFKNFNPFSESELCDGINNDLSVCRDFTSTIVDEEELKNDVKNYTDDNKTDKGIDLNIFIDFFRDYYLYFIFFILAIVALIIFLRFRRRRSVLE